MCTRRQIEDFTSESGHALLDLPSQHGHHGEEQSVLPSPRPTSPNDSFRDPTLRDESSETPFSAYPEKASVNAPFSRRLGRYLLFCNIGALILLLGAISVLSFLWLGNDGNSHWTTIMIDGWVGQAVTLSTLAVRLAVATQASTAVAMLAAIELEAKQGRGVLLADAPAISVARHGNAGPLTSILTFWNGASWTRCGIVLPLMAILALCTLISQFTSTLLLWDVRSGVVHGFSQITRGAVGMDMKDYIVEFARAMTGGDDYWTPSPQSFPTFAEYNAKPRVQTASIVDTGPTIRGFLPIGSQSDRSMVSTFEGTAAVFDARVVCIRPVLTDWKFSSGPTYFEGYAKPSELTEELDEILRFTQSERGFAFRCSFDDAFFLTDPMFRICWFNQTSGGLINSLDPLSNGSLGYVLTDAFPGLENGWTWKAFTDPKDQAWPVELGHTFFIIRTKGNSTLGTRIGDFRKFASVAADSRGVWEDFTAPDFSFNISAEISVTMCYDAWYHTMGDVRVKHLQDYPIFASRLSNISEPSLGWDSRRKIYNTTMIRSQLAAYVGDNTNRAILELDIKKLRQSQQTGSRSWDPNRHIIFKDVSGLDYSFPNMTRDLNLNFDLDGGVFDSSEDDFDRLFNHTMNETYDYIHKMMWEPLHARAGSKNFEISALCGNCHAYVTSRQGSLNASYKALNPIFNAIFRDTLIETDNPALAWQALTTAVARMAYYDWLPTFDSYANITTTSMVSCQIPMHRTGFTIVVANIIVHFSLFIAITIWFYKATKTSLLNNAWQAVAQLNCRETEEILHRATTATDAEVKKWIKEGQEPRRRFRVVSDGRSDRVYLS